MEGKSSKSVLLTGGTGFIGSFLGMRLLEEGYKVFFLARRKNNKDARERIRERLSMISPAASKYANQWSVLEGDTWEGLLLGILELRLFFISLQF